MPCPQFTPIPAVLFAIRNVSSFRIPSSSSCSFPYTTSLDLAYNNYHFISLNSIFICRQFSTSPPPRLKLSVAKAARLAQHTEEEQRGIYCNGIMQCKSSSSTRTTTSFNYIQRLPSRYDTPSPLKASSSLRQRGDCLASSHSCIDLNPGTSCGGWLAGWLALP